MEPRINPVTAHLFMEKRTRRGRIIRPLFRRLASQVSISVYNAQSVAVVIKSHEGEKMAHRALEGTNYVLTALCGYICVRSSSHLLSESSHTGSSDIAAVFPCLVFMCTGFALTLKVTHWHSFHMLRIHLNHSHHLYSLLRLVTRSAERVAPLRTPFTGRMAAIVVVYKTSFGST